MQNIILYLAEVFYRNEGGGEFLYDTKLRESVASRPTLKLMHNVKQKRARVATLVSDKIDLRTKKITRDKEKHYIMMLFHSSNPKSVLTRQKSFKVMKQNWYNRKEK